MTFADVPQETGLIYDPDSEHGIRRTRTGVNFTCLASDGTSMDAQAERDRISALAVSAAYEEVWISPMARSHLQATGLDNKARKQYRYHADWTAHHARMKFDKLIDFSKTLPCLHRWIASRLRGGVGDLDATLAASLALIDRAPLRFGNSNYSRKNGS
jgi:DNA topoisomerase-1